jgi:hypothetical protein
MVTPVTQIKIARGATATRPHGFVRFLAPKRTSFIFGGKADIAARNKLVLASIQSSVFQQCYRAQPTIGTDADNGSTSFGHRSEFLDGLAQDPRTGRGEGMTEGDTAAIWVHAIAWKRTKRMIDARLFPNEVFIFQALDVAEHLRRECFVNFPESNILEF